MVLAKRLSAVLSGLLIIAFALVGLNSVLAQQPNEGQGSGLSISPTRTELNIARGESEKVQISLRNITRGPIVAKPFINDFEADNETGEPKLYKDVNQRNSASVFPFIKGLQDITLAPGESKELTYDVQIPNDAAPGGYYGALAYRAVPADQAGPNAGEVALTANVASLVLIEVPGDITEQVQLTSIKAYKGDKAGSFFLTAPDKVGVSINNQGNSFAKPFGSINVTDMFGKEVYKYELNNQSPRGNVLPKSSRTFKDDLKNIKKPGRYTVTANVSYGSGGVILIHKATFWYMPLWLIVLLVVVLAAILLGAYLVYKRRFSGKKRR